jgi:hypothetical protein
VQSPSVFITVPVTEVSRVAVAIKLAGCKVAVVVPVIPALAIVPLLDNVALLSVFSTVPVMGAPVRLPTLDNVAAPSVFVTVAVIGVTGASRGNNPNSLAAPSYNKRRDTF